MRFFFFRGTRYLILVSPPVVANPIEAYAASACPMESNASQCSPTSFQEYSTVPSCLAFFPTSFSLQTYIAHLEWSLPSYHEMLPRFPTEARKPFCTFSWKRSELYMQYFLPVPAYLCSSTSPQSTVSPTGSFNLVFGYALNYVEERPMKPHADMPHSLLEFLQKSVTAL